MKLREAINDWERKSNEIRELRYFWLVGFLALLAGAWAFRRGSEWPGVALYFLAFSEMIWWTSPSFGGGPEQEFTRLLDQKILFTVLALALLFATWRWGSLKPDANRREGAG
jgi:cytosine/uracil/thiamine/allantoin permease